MSTTNKMPARYSNFLAIDETVRLLEAVGAKFKLNRKAALCIQRDRLFDACEAAGIEPARIPAKSYPWEVN